MYTEVMPQTFETAAVYELAKDFAGPTAAVLGATAASFIAWRFGRTQARVAQTQADTALQNLRATQRRLALDLFDKRSEVVQLIRSAIAPIAMTGKYIDEAYWQFGNALGRAQ